MKKTLLFFVLIVSPNAFGLCLAQDKVQGVIVELSSGKKLKNRLTDNPRMKYDGQTITITGDGVNVQYNPLEIVKVKMGEVDVSAGNSENDSQQGVIIELSNGERLEYGWADGSGRVAAATCRSH